MTIITDRKKGFTLAEVLITLTIIGVVAALTIPSLLANVTEKTYASKRKGLATRMAQAISQIGTITAYKAIPPSGSTEADYTEKYSSMNFVTQALSKVYNIKTMCEYDKLDACDFPKTFTYVQHSGSIRINNIVRLSDLNSQMASANGTALDTYGTLFKTKNGESIFLWYNPNCQGEQEVDKTTLSKNIGKELCLNMIYDLDGARKGPNMIGRDIGFMSVFYADQPYLVVPDPPIIRISEDANLTRTQYGSNSATNYCKNVHTIYYQTADYRLPSREFLYVMAVNSPFSFAYDKNFWSTTVEGPNEDDYGWQVNPYRGTAKKALRNTAANVACIRAADQ